MGLYMFLCFYVPYRSYLYYKESPAPKFSTFILLLFIISSHFFSLLLLANQISGNDFSILSDKRAYNKFILIPLLLLPFIFFMLLFYNLNRDAISNAFRDFDMSPESAKKVRNTYFWIYVVFSIVLFFASITSPLWLKI